MSSTTPEPGADTVAPDEDTATAASGRIDGPEGTRTGPGSAMAGVALLLGLLALGLSVAIAAFGWWRLHQPLDEAFRQLDEQAPRLTVLETALDELRRGLGSEREQFETRLGEEVVALRGGLQALETAQNAIRDDLRAQTDWRAQTDVALQGMRRYLGQTRRDWLLNEAEYLLVVANRRLLLEGDVATAIAALQFADESLRELDDTRWLSVRRSLAAELRALRSVKPVDVEGVDLAIQGLAGSVATLPLSGFQRSVADAVEPPQGRWWVRLRAVLEGIVNVQRVDDPPEPLLPPGQRFFLSQNLALKLEAARLGLVRRDAVLYRTRLEEADALLARYFEASSGQVQAAREAIAEWLGVPVGQPLPRIGEALSELRSLRQAGAVLDEAATS